MKIHIIGVVLFILIFTFNALSQQADEVTSPPTTLDDFFLPGSQPGESGNLEHPNKCDNCHGGYDQAAEPAFNWRGSMMAQAARDPLFYACLAIANQDAPESGDLCIRCHSPAGWLEGRSIPTDGSALNNNDREGVQCDFCHKLIKPAAIGSNPYPNDPKYELMETLTEDQAYLATISDHIPPTSANGMYIADNGNEKRGPFSDAEAKHQMLYSPYHPEAALCGTCHDVSNPVYEKSANGEYVANEWGTPAADFNPYAMFPIERTYSEWFMSDFNSPGGVSDLPFGGNKASVSTCQDCHMRDVSGYGCNKRGIPHRDDLPLHDMTGGNTFIPTLIDAVFPGETDPTALTDGIHRATEMLKRAATIDLDVILDAQANTAEATVTVTNQSGHKLPSGYPEGRRIWIHLHATDGNGNEFISGDYNFDTAVLTHDAQVKIYEIKPGISASLASVVNLEAGPSFHFVLNNEIYSDNRIPPRGFTNANFEQIQSPPVNYTYADGQNWDETTYSIDFLPTQVEATLYYQTLSKEYVEFLLINNTTNHWGQTLYDLWTANGMSAPVAMISAGWGTEPEDNIPPTAPSNLSARAASESKIDLTWDASTDNIGIEKYTIYRQNASGIFESAGETTDLSFTDTELLEQTPYLYQVTAFDAAGNESPPSNTASATTKKSKGGGKPIRATIVMAGPNPMNPETTFEYQLSEAGEIRFEIYNVYGQLVHTLVKGWQNAGTYQVRWNASDLPSGTYIARLITAKEAVARKVILIK